MGIIAGVDCHKDSHTIVFVSAFGKPLKTVTITADGTGYRRAIAIAKELGDDVIWGLESTGSYGSVFAQELDSSGFVVFEVPGVLTKRERKRSTTRGKSDPIDARAIADTVLRESERLPRYHFSVDREAIRLRYDHRNRMVRERTALINRVRSAAIRLDMQGLPVKFYGQKRLLQLAERLKERRGANMALDAVVDDALYAIEDIVRLDERIKGIEVTLDPLMRRIAPELLEMYGVSIVTAAGLSVMPGTSRTVATPMPLRCAAVWRRCRARADASKARVSTPVETVSSIGSCTRWL